MHLGVLENLLTAAAVSLSDFQSMATNKSSEEFQPSEVVLFNGLTPPASSSMNLPATRVDVFVEDARSLARVVSRRSQ